MYLWKAMTNDTLAYKNKPGGLRLGGGGRSRHLAQGNPANPVALTPSPPLLHPPSPLPILFGPALRHLGLPLSESDDGWVCDCPGWWEGPPDIAWMWWRQFESNYGRKMRRNLPRPASCWKRAAHNEALHMPLLVLDRMMRKVLTWFGRGRFWW